ncbi:MAG: hypothetical protein Q4Q04_02495 [Methanocorpusculum sp.]|nr:hypothetical protein [Methanocorpusculum sp.]
MILHDAVDNLREVAAGMGTEDGDLIFQSLPENEVCRFCRGACMGAEFGGRVAEVAAAVPFSARMRLEDMYGAALKSPKTRGAALGALNAAAGFLMLTRKTGACNSVYHEDCLAELQEFCRGRCVYVIGGDIPGVLQALVLEEADLVVVFGDAFFADAGICEAEEAIDSGKEVVFLGQNCHGLGALLHVPVWCPYGK